MSSDLLGNHGAPKIVCAGCGKPTTLQKPICDACQIAAGFVPTKPCILCERGLPLDARGVLHLTKAGGHAGRCTAEPV